MSGCPQESLSALVDGALSHGERDRLLSHLACCATCRREVEAQRALKARLARLGPSTPAPPAELLDRLRGLAVPGVEPSSARPAPAPLGRAAAVPPGRHPGSRGPQGAPGRTRPPRTRTRTARRTSTVGGGLLLVGVGLALVLGGPSTRAPSTPVDPGSDTFVVDFVSTTSEVPLTDPAGRAALLPRP